VEWDEVVGVESCGEDVRCLSGGGYWIDGMDRVGKV
jgi:hypothetical protein